jgi:PPOX class probable F420-dependent enzyme
MASFTLPDPRTPFGARVAEHLRDDIVAWLTTVSGDGTPQPNPIWFLWDGESFLIYTLANAARLRNIARNPRVAFNFDGNRRGGDIVVITGTARLTPDEPPASQNPSYLAKYGSRIDREFHGPEAFSEEYSVPFRVTPLAIRGF